MSMPPKRCPECREEYVHSATLCVHCGVDLVPESELSDVDGSEDLPPVSELVCVRASSVGWAMALSERLVEAGIPHRIQAAGEEGEEGRGKPGQDLPYGVFVLEDDLEAATEVDAEHTEYQIPDIPENFDPLAESENCPACGDPIDAEANECGGCGLALIALE
jgi:hypothetical protein